MATEPTLHRQVTEGDPEWTSLKVERIYAVPVKSICVEHWLPPIRGREFCAGGTEHDMGDWWEWDCNIRKVPDGD